MKVVPSLVFMLMFSLSLPAHSQDIMDTEACFAGLTPVVHLDYGSRYTDDSQTRSEFDATGNAEVDKALGPIDDFITELARESNRALSRKGERATRSADCVLDHLAAWAKADALSDLQTEAVRLSIPSRLSGLAFAYANALPVASQDAARKALIEAWLLSRAQATMNFFDTEAPPRAARNNLRAWAALAIARIGLTLGDDDLVDWADGSIQLVICDANPDGSLPREMERGPLALHYQIHALGPLVMTAALFQERKTDLFSTCNRAIPRAVGFMQAALEKPELAAAYAGAAQSFSEDPPETLQGFEIAWAAAYLRFQQDPALAAMAAGFDPLANSKFGGDQRLIWDPEEAKAGTD